jgi:hypothetical protein
MWQARRQGAFGSSVEAPDEVILSHDLDVLPLL